MTTRTVSLFWIVVIHSCSSGTDKSVLGCFSNSMFLSMGGVELCMDHQEFKNDYAGGTIPFDLTVRVEDEDGNRVPRIRCNKCDEHFAEEEFEWVDSVVHEEDGRVDVESITLECGGCGGRMVAR